jgi:predicted ATPase with chaperone activity
LVTKGEIFSPNFMHCCLQLVYQVFGTFTPLARPFTTCFHIFSIDARNLPQQNRVQARGRQGQSGMGIGNILVAKGLVSAQDIQRAVDYQTDNGGRIGDAIVALGILSKDQIELVLAEAPQAPITLADTGVDAALLLELAIKGMYSENLETATQIAEMLKLPSAIVNHVLQEAKERKFVENLASTASMAGSVSEMRMTLTKSGREWAVDAMSRGQYYGPAPVSLKDFQDRIMRQRVTNEHVTREKLDDAFKGLVMTDRFVNRLGPAINSGNAILIYGPAGNGKTTVAEIVGKIFQNVIYVPYCVDIDGEIMKVFDPAVHKQVTAVSEQQGPANLRRSRVDARWIACYRPMVITGGELTIEMLDLTYNPVAKFYEAPLHIKALNGTFLIDDFGRQRAKPEDILNRWIVPLNSRVDYLTTHTGKSITIPFDEIVIFSTNMHPDDLMDPAFQRRISYKLETVEPPKELFYNVFCGTATKAGLVPTPEIYQQIIDSVRANNAPLAYFQPKFIVEQVLASCKFEGIKPQFTRDNVDDALANLFVKKNDGSMFGVARSSQAPRPQAAAPAPVVEAPIVETAVPVALAPVAPPPIAVAPVIAPAPIPVPQLKPALAEPKVAFPDFRASLAEFKSSMAELRPAASDR